MTDVLKTYPVVIPSMGLARMVMASAFPYQWATPPDRRCGCLGCEQYFQVIDRITRGEKP